jgi:hypothetical protein
VCAIASENSTKSVSGRPCGAAADIWRHGPGVALRFTPGYVHSVPSGRGGDGVFEIPRGCAALHPWLRSFRPCGTWRGWSGCDFQGLRCASPLATFIPSLRDAAGMGRLRFPGVSLRSTPGYIHFVPSGRGGRRWVRPPGITLPRGFAALHPWHSHSVPAGRDCPCYPLPHSAGAIRYCSSLPSG